MASTPTHSPARSADDDGESLLHDDTPHKASTASESHLASAHIFR
jgi:hypothetical protein